MVQGFKTKKFHYLNFTANTQLHSYHSIFFKLIIITMFSRQFNLIKNIK